MKSVIARVIRNTRVQDLSYIADAHEWVWEAMGMLKTKQTLKGVWKPLVVDFHKAKLPCDLVYLEAVECEGNRIPLNNSLRTPSRETAPNLQTPTFQSLPTDGLVGQNEGSAYTRNVTRVTGLAPVEGWYYKLDDPGYITTSFADGELVIYYRAVPTDTDGMPLIPDNENYKQALYWYVRAMMIGAGFEDKQFSYQFCFSQFEEIYGPRAIGEIRYPSPDRMEEHLRASIRLLPAANYYENFFRVDSAERNYDL
jgi:hypothetical protein